MDYGKSGVFSMRNAIILAAGKGTRMKSDIPKVMHKLLDQPMLSYIIDALKTAQVDRIILVVGYQAQTIMDAYPEIEAVIQDPQLGTGHAVMCAKSKLAGQPGQTIIINGDGPCIQAESLNLLFEQGQHHALTLLSTKLDQPAHYGRIVRDEDGQFEQIVEAKDASEKQLAIQEINAGIYCFDNRLLFEYIDKLEPNNAQKEYYLTDMVGLLKQAGQSVSCLCLEESQSLSGINDPLELSEAEKYLQKRINHAWMKKGVQIIDPATTWIGPKVQLGHDVIIYPNVRIVGDSQIGDRTTILSSSTLINAKIGDQVTIDSSRVTDSQIGNGTTLGPMSHLRNGCQIGQNCRIGNFVEMKNTQFGDGSKCAHLTYVGDAVVGQKCNFGCGVVTVNYDGKNKFKTIIGDEVFIGSNVNLIAPVTIGHQALLAAGSTITEDVNDGDMGIARDRQKIKPGYGKRYLTK